jgi:glutamate-ammonia-ligase adenylyltransferase
VKQGRGGIREVELFTQVLQLTYGAIHPEIREPGTLPALGALERAGLVSREVRAELVSAYEFLRTVEHRLQIVHDQRTHSLARAERELEISARRLGFQSVAVLEAELERRRTLVHEVYRTIFERRSGTADFRSRQFFRLLVDEAPEAEAMDLLAGSGMEDPAAAIELIRGLDQTIALASSRTSARNVLANLLPRLLDRIRECASPPHVLMRFEQISERTGAPASFFRTLLEDDALLESLIATLNFGELTANRLIRYPELLDSLSAPSADLESRAADYARKLSRLDPETGLHQLPRFKAVEEFKIVAQWVKDDSLGWLQERLSVLADALVTAVAARHAPSPEGEPDWAVFAMGKLGGRELTVHSDLDLVVVYRGDPADAETFLRHQNFVAAMGRELEEPTGEGIVYPMDTRLRPEGKKGALAMPFENFVRYLRERAEIWERLAWTRHRFVTGSRRLADDVQAAVQEFVYGGWSDGIPQYVRNLRARMERELTSAGVPEFKVGRGGLADMDFALQLVQIREGRTRPEFRIAGTRQLLDALPPTGFLTNDEVTTLRQAHDFLRRLETLARLASDTHVTALPADPAKLEGLGRRMGFRERAGEALLEKYQAVADAVRQVFDAVVARTENPSTPNPEPRTST